MKKLNSFELSLITIISMLNIVSFIVTKDVNLLGIISSITGVICVVLTAKGSISCYYWGLINIGTYIIIALKASLYGEVMLNTLYYLPMQFIGMYLWRKHMNQTEETVQANKMTKPAALGYTIATILGVILYGLFLNKLGGNQPFIDATTTILSVTSMLLSVKRLKEQWLLWIIVDVVSVYMWIVALRRGEANSMVMILMWVGYLVNAFYGYIKWNQLEKR